MPFPRYSVNREDPELAAERAIDKANGITKKPVAVPITIAPAEEAEVKSTTPACTKSASLKEFKEAKASRKKRSRGVSGSSIKKDGGKFDLGMENLDAFDDVSDQEGADDYRHYEKYVSDHYSSHSNGIGSDSELSRDSPLAKNNNNAKAVSVAEALLSTDPGVEVVGHVAELLMEEYDETGRTAILEMALEVITQDMKGAVLTDVQCEYNVVAVIARLMNEGLLSKTSVGGYVDNAPENTHAIRLLNSALICVAESAPEVRGELKLKPPTALMTLAREMCSGSEGDVCGIATNLTGLKMPYYHAHFVYQVCVEAIFTQNMDLIFFSTGALKDLVDHRTVSETAIKIGFARFFASIQDLEVDLPGATSLATLLASYATNDHKLIGEDLYGKCPKPKRFLLMKATSSGKLTVLDANESNECNETNYFVMEN